MACQNQTTIFLADLLATQKFGHCIGQFIRPNTVLTLSGNMGSGKTTLIKSIAQALDIKEPVTSPTFVMMNEYHSGRIPLYHLDLYRLKDESTSETSINFLSAQLEEIINTDALIFIEWAQVLSDHYQTGLGTIFENGFLDLNLAPKTDDPESRVLTISFFGKNASTAFSLFSNLANCQKIF